MQNTLNTTTLRLLTIGHIFLLTLSNVLVQYPFELLGFHTTWGAFSYPAIFILTDLTTRLSNAQNARSIIFRSMVPGLIISYIVASSIELPQAWTIADVFTLYIMPLRIAFACLCAYVLGQFLDIFVFQKYQNKTSWWLAPMVSSTLGNIIDTWVFFSVAFYHCNNAFMSQHWPEIAVIDLLFKISISVIAFIPVYGFVLNLISSRTKIMLAK